MKRGLAASFPIYRCFFRFSRWESALAAEDLESPWEPLPRKTFEAFLATRALVAFFGICQTL